MSFLEEIQKANEIEKKLLTRDKKEWEAYFKLYNDTKRYLIENNIEFENITITRKAKKWETTQQATHQAAQVAPEHGTQQDQS